MEPPPKPPFTATLEQLEKNKSTFSTSPDVTFPPPTLLVQLSEKEGGVGKDDRMADLFGLKDAGDETIKHSLRPKTILSSYDKAGLMSISGWHGLSNLSGMIGSGAFVRHQGLTVLYSEKIPISLAPIAEPSSDTTSSNSVNRISVSCFGPRWKTYRYYNPTSDKSLGQLFRDFCMDALSGKSCGTGGCKVPRAFHELNWVHNGVRIHGLLGKADGAADGNPEKDPTLIWTSCKVCQSATDKKEMTDGTL
jgi:1-phosphatidylinositol-3-phosphate 5-kinase